MEQRERAIRFWLELDDTDPLPSAAEAERRFMDALEGANPAFPESAKANFMALARGGASTDYLFLACYVDYSVDEYLLGAGPTSLTVAYNGIAETRSYDLYRRSQFVGEFGGAALLLHEGEYQAKLALTAEVMEGWLGSIVGGYESVVFLAPMGAHDAIAVEAWQVVEQWDLETDDDDVVHAVRYGVAPGDPEQTQTLANLKSRVTTAAASDAFAGQRIANASGLRQYYRDIGAYGDITPDDGSTATFTPSQPPDAYTCVSGTAVTDPTTNLGLVHDCEVLLEAEDSLRGTATLNWDTGTAIGSWDGVTTAGTPARVTELELPGESLTGSIPASLGTLFELTHLDLSNNSLTGDIPAELGWLHNLEEVRLSGNSLTGCIPIALRSVATNDLPSLNLPYCRPPAPNAPTAGTVTETSIALNWTAAANVSKYRVGYREGGFGYWTVDDDAIASPSHTVDELLCGREYQFRLSAYGSGTGFGAAWSDPSETLTASTGACTPPVFDAASYSFEVMEDAALDAAVGTVSATDDGTDPVTYAITAGNEEGLFAISDETGAITVAADLSGKARTMVALTVAARDAAGGEATVAVAVNITETCESGTAVPNPGSNSGLVADCKALLGLKGAFAGTASLNWSASIGMGTWEGVTLGGRPRRVTGLDLERRGLTGVIPPALGNLEKLQTLELGFNDLSGGIPAELGNLAELRDLYLNENQLAGAIPAELGNLSALQWLWLPGNALTGPIPQELGNLSALTRLWLQGNALTGPIPQEMGRLSNLEWLWLESNDLDGTIPAELTELTNLNLLRLGGNNLVGCVPASLRDVDIHDLDDLGLSDCQQGPAAPTGLSGSLSMGTFSLSWTALSGVDRYEPQVTTDAADAMTVTWTALGEVTAAAANYTPTGGVPCGTAHRFRVRAHGDGHTYATHWGPESAAVTVSSPACEPPVLDDYNFEVAEDAEVGDVVGTVSATDPEGDAVTYAITAGNTGGAFAIDSGTGEITVAAALDHETTDEYTLTVEAEDVSGLTDTATLTITVTDIAEEAPPAPTNVDATLAGGTFTITWDAVVGASKYEPQVTTDAADAQSVTWAALPEVTAASATYAPTGGPECSTEYRFRARAYGDGVVYTAMWSAESEPDTLTTPNCVPEFGKETYAFDVAEDAAVDHVVGSVSAMDDDIGDTLTYRITAGNTGNAFAIDDGTGEITVAAALDHEMTDEYTLTVEVDDGNGGTDTATVTVTVTDIAEDAPPAPTNVDASLAGGTFTITWDAVVGAAKYEPQVTTDAADAQSVTWTALPEVTTATATYAPTDGPECGTAYRFRVRAYGDGTVYTEMWGAESQPDTVPAPNCVPEFGQETYAFDVAEDAAVDHVVGSVSATDEDAGDTLTYRITAGNTGSAFAIGGAGAITVAAALDYETTDEYTLTVEAADGNGGTDTARVTVTVTDVVEYPPPAPTNVDATLAGETFTITWDALVGASKYEPQVTTDATDAETVTWTALPEVTAATAAYAPTGGPACGTEYRFRVRAYGDGTDYTEMWGAESAVDTVTTVNCVPEFGQEAYTFFIQDSSALNSGVGSVSATDGDAGDTLSYRIAAGNDDGKFSIDASTGQLSVAGALDIASTPTYRLTVEVSDGNAATDTARVTVSLTIAECYNDTVVQGHAEQLRQVRDCSVLLTARDTLRGTATLNWSSSLSMREWEGITTGYLDRQYFLGAPIIVNSVIVARRGLDGTIPSVLAGLVDLGRLDLDDNALTGTIPAALGQLEDLELLHLFGNHLTGSIPAELGNLSDLRVLSLYANDLGGNIPSELGRLTNLEQLLLDDNDFTGQLPSELANITGLEQLYVRESQLAGEIPAWLASLDDLEHLFIEGNDFTGCIPAGLRDVTYNDLDSLGLTDCT